VQPPVSYRLIVPVRLPARFDVDPRVDIEFSVQALASPPRRNSRLAGSSRDHLRLTHAPLLAAHPKETLT
jgi:hypothetical protein